MKVETAALKKDLKGRVKDTKKVSKEIEQLRSTVAKQRLLLLARLRDYAKELEFWRNAVRTLILRKGGDLEAADALIERITQQLGTLGTKGSAETYETIRVVAAWTAEAESGQQPKKSSKRPGGDGA